MAKVTPVTPARGFPNSSFNVSANFTNRGTGSAGTTSRGACTVPLGASGSAATDCCASTRGTPKPKQNTTPTPIHLMVRFMTPLLSSETEEIQVAEWIHPLRHVNSPEQRPRPCRGPAGQSPRPRRGHPPPPRSALWGQQGLELGEPCGEFLNLRLLQRDCAPLLLDQLPQLL